MVIELKAKKALVCGGSRGIGRAIAEVFAKAGAEVHLVARGEADLAQAMTALKRDHGQRHGSLSMDLGNSTSLDKGIPILLQRGPYHILVNNSSGPVPKRITESSPADLLQVFNQHMIASHRLTMALLAGMRSIGQGRIINVMGTSHKSIVVGLGPSVMRASVGVWAKALSREVAGDGITVNNLLAGPVDGGELPNVIQHLARIEGITSEELETRVRHDVPAGRFATLQEIAEAALYLASDNASFITGSDLIIDGGSMRSA